LERIISVSAKLFAEKGYEKTSMQDIVEALGMSKGAIFYHFKSKDDIFKTVVSKQSEYAEQTVQAWINEMNGLTAKEKLIRVLENNLSDQQLHALDNAMASQIQSPHFVLAHMQDSVNKSAPIFAKIMREGIEDGSITTAFPEECAEVFFLLMNIWCDHMIFVCDMTHLSQRMKFLQQIMKQMGADIVSDKLLSEHMLFMEKLYGGSGV
jgi:TetR/AcrR family acrAB operon transcriptional repressor